MIVVPTTISWIACVRWLLFIMWLPHTRWPIANYSALVASFIRPKPFSSLFQSTFCSSRLSASHRVLQLHSLLLCGYAICLLVSPISLLLDDSVIYDEIACLLRVQWPPTKTKTARKISRPFLLCNRSRSVTVSVSVAVRAIVCMHDSRACQGSSLILYVERVSQFNSL